MKVSELDILFTATYKPSDVYSESAVIPEGYEMAEFRQFRKGDTILGLATNCVMDVNWDAKPSNGPFIILRKKREFHEKYRFAKGLQPRQPKSGDLYLSSLDNPSVCECCATYENYHPRFIVEEIKDNA